ncbi:hypothetical protein [Microbacterium sp.]|uniref:hypothetical protein n=1 Tax=Microbacterium sp. TaxID=51671 RepID=UPI003A8864A4
MSTLATVALVFAFATPATADTLPNTDANDVAALVSDAAPAAELADPGIVTSEELTTSSAGVKTSVALDPNGGIAVVATGADSVLLIELPATLPLDEGIVASDGTAVFLGADASGDALAVQTLADGSTRVQAVISGAGSPHEFDYGIQGFAAAVNDKGEAAFVSSDGSFVPVAAAWATDADGKAVATHYEVSGDKLVQVVMPNADTTYPVVADPSWVWIGAGWGMKLTRSETSSVRNYAAAVGMCTAFSRRAPGLAVGCAVWGAYIQLQANLAQSDRPKTCLFFNVVPAPGSIWRVGC